ncbi:histidine phosphatase family protein [Candidatus Dependentiae bacterium]|nr:histidine phosphatase family protein [Candidatus Dependentiae bacterium]
MTIQILPLLKPTDCHIYLVRHGQTDWNKNEKMMGSSDIPLNETGQKQVLKVKEKFNALAFAAAFSSDKMRTHKTAELILGANNIPIIETAALRECSFGAWEGRPTSEFKTWARMQPQRDTTSQADCLAHKLTNDTESLGERFTRVATFMQSVALQYRGATVLCCTHAGVLRAILCALNFRPGFSWYVANGAFIYLRVAEDGKFTLIQQDGCLLMHESF